MVGLGQLSKIRGSGTTQHKAVIVVFDIVCDEDVGGRVGGVFYAIGAKVWDTIKPFSNTDCNVEKVKVTQLLCRAKVKVAKYVLRVVWLVIQWDVSKLELVIRYVQYFKCTIHAKQLEAKATDATSNAQ